MSAKVHASVSVKDTGWAAFGRAMREIAKGDPHVKVGVFVDHGGGGEAREGGVTNVELAAIHEFGVPARSNVASGHVTYIPERSFLRSSFEANKAKYKQRLEQLLKSLVAGKIGLRKVFDLLGAEAASDIKRGITQGEGIPPPLAESTVARKGSSRPLVDTGRLLAAITWVTEVGGRG